MRKNGDRLQLLIIFLIWYFAFGKDNPKFGKTMEDKLGFIIVACIALSVIGSLLTVISVFVAIFGVLLSMGIPIMILWVIAKKLLGKPEKKKGKGWFEDAPVKQNKPATGKSGLVKSSAKRRKLIAKFNKKYGLCLSDSEIDRINEASYVSYEWEQEVLAMEKNYDSVSEWYASETGWLRAYFRAFSVQNISSDFAYQKMICIDSFTQIFNSVDMSKYDSIDSCIEDINAKYFTFFDEATFMIAYRFLEANGRRFKLPGFGGVYKYESEIDKLKQKYDQEMDVVDDVRRKLR